MPKTCYRDQTSRDQPKRFGPAWLFAIALACLASGSTGARSEERPSTVSVVVARAGGLTERVRIVGTLVAREESVVKVDLEDVRIVSVKAEIGDIVRRGDVLALLDSTLITIEQSANAARLARADAAIAQSQSQIDDADLAYAQAQSDVKRSKQLRAKGFAAEETLEGRQTVLKRAASALELARQSLGVAKADRQIIVSEGQEIAARLARTEIVAPTDGLVLRRTAKVGALTAASGDPLFAIAENGEIELDAEIPEANFVRMAIGQVASISMPGQVAKIAGQVRLLAPEASAGSRLGRARISLLPTGPLVIGAFARGDLAVERRDGVFLPATSVQSSDGRSMVQIVESDVITLRPVGTGLRSAGLVEILSGVVAGERVVLRAGNFLSAGDRVSPLDVDYAVAPASDRPILTSDAAR